MTDRELINLVVSSYEETQSFKRTAAALHISTAKVRKALLTAGVWTNDTAEHIAELRTEHPDWTDEKISAYLHISLNAVQMYTPYKLGPYTGDGPSAKRMAGYRERNRAQADSPDGNRKEVASQIKAVGQEQEQKEEADESDPWTDPHWREKTVAKDLAAGLPFSSFRHNPDPNAMPHVDDQFFLDYRRVEHANYHDRSPRLLVMRILLSVNTDDMSVDELAMIEKDYGVKTGWTRELIVPSGLSLHHFHYLIQRAFGFENKADHLYQFTPADFDSALNVAGEGSLRDYCRLCGILFRFPFMNDEELYWDEDYNGKKSIRSWLKEKYQGGWDTNAGTGYGYADNQYRIWKWLGDKVPDIHVLAEALETYSDEEMCAKLKELGAPEEYSIGEELDEAEVPESGQFPFNNVLENIHLEEILSLNPEPFYCISDHLEEAESELLDNLLCLEEARETMEEAKRIYALLEKRMKSGYWDEDVLLVKKWREKAKEAAKKFVYVRGGASTLPVVRNLVYLYDFGEKKGGFIKPVMGAGDEMHPKWRIKIELLDQYYDNSIYYSRNYNPSDANGVPFQNDPEHEAEMADRLLDMCHWKEKLEICDSADRWIMPTDEKNMMLDLRPEQELLPEERERIEEDRRRMDDYYRANGWLKEHETVVDDKLYTALKEVMLEGASVCVSKEGAEPGEGYPDTKGKNRKLDKLV